jgi:hypothetical protein
MNCTNSIAYERMFALATCKNKLSRDETSELHTLLARFETTYDDARLSGYKADDESEWASEGTRAHDFAEAILKGKAGIMDVPEKNDMRKAVASYVEECQRLEAESSEMGMFVEEQVPLFYDESSTGTMDFAVASKERVRVRDYKHGAGVYVEAEENSQLAIYALSTMKMLEDEGYYKFDPDTLVEIGIWQPRHRLWDPSHLWVLTYHDLKAWGREIQQKADEVDSGAGVFAPDDEVCRWCKLKAFCGARRHHIMQGMPTLDDHDEIDFLTDLPDFKERGSEGKFDKSFPSAEARLGIYTLNYPPLTESQMAQIFRNRKGIEKFLEDIAKYMTQRALDGNPVEGTKLVNGVQGNRAWASDDAAESFMVGAGIEPEQMYQPLKVISVTEAEKLLGDKVEAKKKKNPVRDEALIDKFKAAVFRSPAKPVLALADDPRDSAVANLDGFDIIEDEDFIES